MHQASNRVDIPEQKAKALTKSALACARSLGLSPHETAATLGVPQTALQAFRAATRSVDGTSSEAACADALVRIGNQLKDLLGDTETSWRSWIRRHNDEIGGKPIEVMIQRCGCLKIAEFLEGKASL